MLLLLLLLLPPLVVGGATAARVVVQQLGGVQRALQARKSRLPDLAARVDALRAEGEEDGRPVRRPGFVALEVGLLDQKGGAPREVVDEEDGAHAEGDGLAALGGGSGGSGPRLLDGRLWSSPRIVRTLALLLLLDDGTDATRRGKVFEKGDARRVIVRRDSGGLVLDDAFHEVEDAGSRIRELEEALEKVPEIGSVGDFVSEGAGFVEADGEAFEDWQSGFFEGGLREAGDCVKNHGSADEFMFLKEGQMDLVL